MSFKEKHGLLHIYDTYHEGLKFPQGPFTPLPFPLVTLAPLVALRP